MIKTAAWLTLLGGLLILSLMDDDGRIVGGDLAGRALGYAVRIEVRIDRPRRVAPPVTRGNADRCSVEADSIVRVVP